MQPMQQMRMEEAEKSNRLDPSNIISTITDIVRDKFSTKQIRVIVSIACTAVVLLLLYLLWSPSALPFPARRRPHKIWHDLGTHKLVKPEGFKIIGLVFYGRAKFVNILDCYLKKNLVKNGGYLDEIRFITHTNKEEDLEWLDRLLATEPAYVKLKDVGSYGTIWNTYGTDPDAMYIKIDDDIIFVHDDAIPRMVHTLIENPQAYTIAANLVNSPTTNWMHYRSNAVLPYLPDTDPAVEVTDWRASKLPKYTKYINISAGLSTEPPHDGHRWLPLGDTSENLMKTPIAKSAEYNAFGRGWSDWRIPVQQHYSLLHHMERGDYGVYWQGNQQGIWNMQYDRYNLNFVAIWGKNVAMESVGDDDEQQMTVDIPKKLHKPLLIDTHAIVGHFSFYTVKDQVGSTDLLERYRLYANEMVCTSNNQKPKM